LGESAEKQHEIKSLLGDKQRLTVREMTIGKVPVAMLKRGEAIYFSGRVPITAEALSKYIAAPALRVP
jgi:hypothetical protein